MPRRTSAMRRASTWRRSSTAGASRRAFASAAGVRARAAHRAALWSRAGDTHPYVRVARHTHTHRRARAWHTRTERARTHARVAQPAGARGSADYHEPEWTGANRSGPGVDAHGRTAAGRGASTPACARRSARPPHAVTSTGRKAHRAALWTRAGSPHQSVRFARHIPAH
eukprot:4163085-Pleurochrysis_carterae.AAC.1